MSLLLALLTPVHASGLDLLEVGGAWGTPGTTDATALWWNPAGIAAGHGSRFTIEVAPTLASVNIQRDNPAYVHDPDAFGPEEYDYSGLAEYKRTAVVPFAGFVSDFGVPGLGAGFGLMVPHGRGAAGDPDQVTHHHLINGGNQALYLTVAAAYEIKDFISFGVSGAYVASTYNSDLYSESGTALNEGIKEELGRSDSYYSDTIAEDTRYAARVSTDDGLTGSTATFGAGARVKANDMLAISLAYRHGIRVDHTGTATLNFGCPSTDDFVGRLGAERQGLCDAQLNADMAVGYNLPGRLQGGVVLTPKPTVRLEAMGGYVFWNVFKDYEIDIRVDPDSVDKDDEDTRNETAELVSQTKTWARDQRNSFWLGLDGKVAVHPNVILGGRVLYDRAAVPDNVVGPNNYDANTVSVTGLVAGNLGPMQLGLSATQYFASRRTVTDSAYGITMYDDKKPVRYFYPSTNGTYASSITRIGVSLRGQFDHGKSKPGEATSPF